MIDSLWGIGIAAVLWLFAALWFGLCIFFTRRACSRLADRKILTQAEVKEIELKWE